MLRIHHPTPAGQAAAEFVGIVAVIGLMVAAIAVWLPGVRLSGGPPPVIEAVARPLEPHDVRLGVPPVRELWEAGQRDDPLDRIARWADAEDRWVRGVLVNRLGIEAVRGARDELRDEIGRLLENPIGYGQEAVTPPGDDEVRDLVGRVGELPGYVRELRGMDPHDALLRVSNDGGRLATRVGLAWVRRRAGQALLRRAARPPPPPPPSAPHRGAVP